MVRYEMKSSLPDAPASYRSHQERNSYYGCLKKWMAIVQDVTTRYRVSYLRGLGGTAIPDG
jgi:hypothetical protein